MRVFLSALLVFLPAIAFAEEKKTGMPQLDPTKFPTQLFWIAVTFLLFFLLMWRVALPKVGRVLEDRKNRIEGDLTKAAELRAEAERVSVAYDKATADGRAQAQAIVRKVTEEMNAVAQQQQSVLAQKLAQDIQAAEARIGKGREAAMGNVAAIAGELAQAATQRLAGVSVDGATAAAAVAAAKSQR